MAAITLALVNSISAGRARSPTVAIVVENRSSSAAGPKNWSASGPRCGSSHGSLPLPQQHQVLQNIAQQGREAYAKRHDMLFSFNVTRK
jgi:hypothetical protein